MTLRLRLATALFTLINVFVFQTPGAGKVQFHNLNQEFNISIRETNSVCGDDFGFIWISSKMGVIRHTQDDIRIYKLPYESADNYTVRLVCSGNKLYAYTNNGQICEYNRISDKFEMLVNLRKELQSPEIKVTRLIISDLGKLWVSSSEGLFSFDQGEGLKCRIKGDNIHCLEWLDSATLFYATDGKIRVFNTQTLLSNDYFQYSEEDSYFVTHLLFEKSDQTLWVGTRDDGVFYLKEQYRGLKFSAVNQIPKQPIHAITRNSDSTILIGIDGQGIWEIRTADTQVLNVYKEDVDNINSLKGNGVYDIYWDKNNRIWVCTYSGGVSYFDQSKPVISRIHHDINKQNSLINNEINSVHEASDGNLWFATNNGISVLDVSTNNWKSLYNNEKQQAQVFLTLCEDRLGRIWAGTYSSGVYLIERQTGRELAHFSQDENKYKLKCNYVFEIYQDTKGDIWLGGVDGDLICYQSDKNSFKSYAGVMTKSMIDYGPDKLLIGTVDGLLLLDKKSGIAEYILKAYMIQDIYLKDDIVWICTSGDGLISYNFTNRVIKKFLVDSGLASNFVNSIDYYRGYFWIGTEQGLCRLDEKDHTIINFSSISDLSNISFNPNAHCLLRNGNLIWGTSKGVVLFNPNEIVPQKEEGQIFFQELLVAGRSIRETSNIALDYPLDSLHELSLKYYQNTISLELIPIGTTSRGSKFMWKLEGLDKEWINPGSNRILSYSNIPSGNYTLRIRMMDNSLTTTLAERAIILNVNPPFWKAWWFKIWLVISLIGLGVFLFTYYIDRLKKRHSDEKIRFFTNTAHDIRTSLTLISGPIEELNKETTLSDKALGYLHLASDQTRRLSSVVTQLMDFQKVDVGKEQLSIQVVDIVKVVKSRVLMFESYAHSKNIELIFKTTSSNYFSATDEALIEKIIDNLISNAIKYSHPNMPVQIDLHFFPHKWTLEFRDQGIGISKKAQQQLFREYYRGENAVNSKIAGSGIGLLLVKKYVEMLGGKVSCSSQQNVGTSFQIVMPVKRTNEIKTAPQLPIDKVVEPIMPEADLPSAGAEETKPYNDIKMKILIVEDHEYMRKFLQSAMDTQFQILLAEDGQQAWKVIQKENPDLVVSDIMMPNMDGFELCSKLKSTYETSHIPIILLTSLSAKAQQLKGLRLGADDYLTKPFDVTLLQQRIRTIIQNRNIIRKKALKIIKANEDETIVENELNDKFLKKMIEVVRANLADPQFNKNDFASAMNVSPSLLYKKIKSLTDQSPTDFIKTVRLEHSLELLRTKRYSITEISELCGFASMGYFSAVFRKHYGKSPTQVS